MIEKILLIIFLAPIALVLGIICVAIIIIIFGLVLGWLGTSDDEDGITKNISN